MKQELNHSDIWSAIEQFAFAHKKSCSGLARCSGLDATTFNRSKRWSREGQPRWPSTQSIAKIIAATDSSIDEFVQYLHPSDTLTPSPPMSRPVAE